MKKIDVKKLHSVKQRAVRCEIIQKRKINVIDKNKSSNRPDIVVVNNGDKNKRVKIVKNKSVRVENVNKNKLSVRCKHVPDKNINKLKDSGRGKILVMIACGPSVNEIDVTKIDNNENIDIMVINKPIPSINPKYWAFCDQSQYTRNKEFFDSYSGTLINSNTVKARKKNQIIVQACQGNGIKRNINEGYIIGRSSVYANLQVAIWMNYDEIYVFGVDMCAVNGKLHHYGVNPDVPEDKRLQRFEFEAAHYDRMANALPDKIKETIYFCSSYNPWPFVNKFNKLDHKTAVDKILEKASSI